MRIERSKLLGRLFNSFCRINGTATKQNSNYPILRNSNGSVRKLLFEILRNLYIHDNSFWRLLVGHFHFTSYLGNETAKLPLTDHVISVNILEDNISLEFNPRLRSIDTRYLEILPVILTRKLFINDTAISKDDSVVVPASYSRTNMVVAFDNEQVPVFTLPPWEPVLNKHRQIRFYCLTFISVLIS